LRGPYLYEDTNVMNNDLLRASTIFLPGPQMEVRYLTFLISFCLHQVCRPQRDPPQCHSLWFRQFTKLFSRLLSSPYYFGSTFRSPLPLILAPTRLRLQYLTPPPDTPSFLPSFFLHFSTLLPSFGAYKNKSFAHSLTPG